MQYPTIIFVTYSNNEARKELARKSFESLISTIKIPAEVIVVDNGGDSEFYFQESLKGNITKYIRNSNNVFFAEGRNEALKLVSGDYVFIMDNDLIYENGWLEECIKVLNETKGNKLLVTPMGVMRCHRKYTTEIKINGKSYIINTLAGSNIWGMNKEDADTLGLFEQHLIAGTLYCRKYYKMGYVVIVLPQKVFNYGKDKTATAGYNKKKSQTFYRKLLNGEIELFHKI
jgi:glycosyltransferase involved in cell wall biosynthesis